MRRSAILGLAAAAVLAVASGAAADGLRWQLGFKNDTPSWVRVPAGEGKTAISWYMTYRVENATGAARKPAVRATLLTDTGREFPDSGDPLTVRAAREKTGLKDLATAASLRDGIEDGKKVTCVAAFGQVDNHAKKMEVRVYGLMDPVTTVKGKQVNEVIYWSAKYERRGDEFGRTEDPWKLLSSGWVKEEPATGN